MLPISLHLKLLTPFAYLSCEYLTLFPVEKNMIFCCKVIILEAKVFIMSQRSSLDDPIALEFVNVEGCLA